ncbi:hypothetical protein AB0G76_30895 [Streptomyces asoensis]|uniref:hypothetical protein n=1 Tax=Streptomyces asoensis TaxID=249586 RepID=UPI00340F3CF5
MARPDRARLRSAGFVVLLTGLFVLVNSQVVYAAGSSESADLLAPLNIYSSEGVPIDGYDLNAQGGSIVAFKTQALAFALSGLFTLIRLLVGLAGWAIEVAFRFPLLKILTRPAQKAADTYDHVVVDALGLKGLLLAWAFVFAGFMIVRGRVGRGLGEIFLTLLIGALAASALIRPDTLLSQDGPLGQAQQVAAEVAQQSVGSYDWGGKLASSDPCAGMAAKPETTCEERQGQGHLSSAEVARPIQDSITNALIVKPYMLLQYGRILDPARPAERKAYAVHLKWITGGYTVGNAKVTDEGKQTCRKIHGPAKKYCQRGYTEGVTNADGSGQGIPSMTPGSELLNAPAALVTDDDRAFDAFLTDMKRAGDVGASCAAYAQKPTWWRVGGAGLLLIAALFICGMLLSSAIVLLGAQGICAAAAAVGGVTFIAGMLPGPARQSVWKWLSIWGICGLTVVGICAFVPFFGIAVDATLTDGPDLMVERILLIDVLAIAGAAGHRRLLSGIVSFGHRMALRMRYAKVGGTHLPGDTSELGAALAMNSPAALGGYGGGLRAFTAGGGGRFGLLGTRQRLMGALTSLADGAGMAVDTGRILADARAEAGRGLAPVTAAAAVGAMGARLAGKGGHWLLIGRRPDEERLAAWRKPTADDGGSGGGGGPSGGPGRGPHRPGGPPDRYRNEDGQIIDRRTGQVLHDDHGDRTLLSTRAHNRLVRLRGYRILRRGSRAAYGVSVGLPATVRGARVGGSQYAHDARQQVRVWANSVREDGRAWADVGRQAASRPVRSRRSAPTAPSSPFSGPTQPTPRPRSSTPTSAPPAGRPASAGRFTEGSGPPPEDPASRRPGPALPGGGSARDSTRDEARRRMQDLLRRTAPHAEQLRRDQSRPQPPQDGDPQ